MSEDGVGVAPVFEQLHGVGERARRERHVVAVRLQPFDERAQDEDVRGVREIGPDAHRPPEDRR